MTEDPSDDLAGLSTEQMVERLSKQCHDLERQMRHLSAEIVDIKKDQWRMEAAIKQLLTRLLELERDR